MATRPAAAAPAAHRARCTADGWRSPRRSGCRAAARVRAQARQRRAVCFWPARPPPPCANGRGLPPNRRPRRTHRLTPKAPLSQDVAALALACHPTTRLIDVLRRLKAGRFELRSELGSRRTGFRFTVHRPASAEVSACCHRPSGGDVASGVHVSVARARTASDALENRLALAVFPRDMPTGEASLRRVRSRDKFEPPRSFVLQPGNQQAPPVAVNLAVEAPFLRDVGARALTS